MSCAAAEQDRSRWNGELIAEGQALVRHCLRRNSPGRHQIQAAINAVHCEARAAGVIDWQQIVQLYDQTGTECAPGSALVRRV